MTEEKRITPKQWQRRALHAEQQVEFLQRVRSMENGKELSTCRELTACRVALKEAQEAIGWALEQQT